MPIDPVNRSAQSAYPGKPPRVTPQSVTDQAALATLNSRFAAFDTAARGGKNDGKISIKDLQAVARNSNDQDLVDAANHLLSNPDLRDRLDVAGEGGGTDGIVSQKDLTSFIVRDAPAAMPSLGTRQVQGSADNPTILQIDAQAPDGASWRNEQGPRAGIVSVYVDGEYVADATVFAENPDGSYQVNLGVLGSGAHKIELRDSTAVGTGTDAGIDPHSVTLSTRELDVDSSNLAERDQALAARYAPNLALADNEQATNNTPLMTTAQVVHHDDGTTTIAYRILYSNEDGGDGADPDKLANRWGRTSDDERIYEVTIDANGDIVDFTSKGLGDDAGRASRAATPDHNHNGLPQIGVSNEHNNVSWTPDPRNRGYSGVPVVVEPGPDFGDGYEPGPSTNALMRDHPWTWRVANAEIAREGKDGVVQPYERLYLNLGTGTFDEGTRIEVIYRNGRTETLSLSDANGKSNSVSVALSSNPGEIASVQLSDAGGSGVEAYYLSAADVPIDVPASE